MCVCKTVIVNEIVETFWWSHGIFDRRKEETSQKYVQEKNGHDTEVKQCVNATPRNISFLRNPLSPDLPEKEQWVVKCYHNNEIFSSKM